MCGTYFKISDDNKFYLLVNWNTNSTPVFGKTKSHSIEQIPEKNSQEWISTYTKGESPTDTESSHKLTANF